MNKNNLHQLLKNIESDIENEIPHEREPTRKHVLEIVKKNLKIFVPMEDEDFPHYEDCCVSEAMQKDAAFAAKIDNYGGPFDGTW